MTSRRPSRGPDTTYFKPCSAMCNNVHLYSINSVTQRSRSRVVAARKDLANPRGPDAMQDADSIVRLQRSRSAAQNFSRGINPMPGHEELRPVRTFSRGYQGLNLTSPSPSLSSPAQRQQPCCPVVHAISARTRKANKTHLRAGPKR
jgi:hypothetical protein